MAAGTVISGGFPGRVAQEVQPNPKCGGCLHYDPQGGRTGVCTIGDRPWNCGDGADPGIGYAPLVNRTTQTGDLIDLVNHGAHAPEVDPQGSSALHGSGSTRPVTFVQVSLGEEHAHLVKSMMLRHADLQKSQCPLCSMRGGRGGVPAGAGFQSCTCCPIEATAIAKAVVSRMSNAERAEVTSDPGWVEGVADWVREVVKAGFKLPRPKRVRGFGSNLVDSYRSRELKALNRPKASLADQVRVDANGGHMRPIVKGRSVDDPHNLAPRMDPNHDFGKPAGKPKTDPKKPDWLYDESGKVRDDVEKAIDNTKHSHVVTGRLAPHGVGASSRNSARAKVDKLDAEYGASAHTAARNPNFRPDSLKWEKTSAHGPGARHAEAGHGTYLHEPQPGGKHVVTYRPHGHGLGGDVHVGSHDSPSAANDAALAHHHAILGN